MNEEIVEAKTNEAAKAPEVVEDGKIVASAPIGCNVCGSTREELVAQFEGIGFLVLQLGIPGVMLFACPKCNMVQTNPEAYLNVKRLDAVRQSKIVRPGLNDLKLVTKSH